MNELKSFLKYILSPGGKHGKKRRYEMSGISRLQKALGESTYDETKKAVVALARAIDSGKNWESEIDKIAKQYKVDVADLRADFEEEYGDIQKYSDKADSKGEGTKLTGTARLEKEMMIFTGNEESPASFAFKVHPADQIRAEKFLKAKQWEYTISKEELVNGYVTVTVPNDYVFMDKKMGYGDMARMMSEYGIRVLKDRTKDNGHEVRTVAEKKRKHGWHGLRSSGKFSKDEYDYYW